MRRSKKQIEAWRLLQDRSKRKILFSGGARSGKSFLIALWIVAVCETFSGVSVGVFRKYRKSCPSSIVKTFQEALRARGGWDLNKSDLILTYCNGSQIQFMGLADDNGEKILGLSLDLAWVNECTEATESEVQIVLSRLSGVNVPVRKLICDCNPKNISHWVRRFFILKQDEQGKPLGDSDSVSSLHFIPTDNPFLPLDTIQTLKALTGTAYKRLWLGEWSDMAGLVFDEFSNANVFDSIQNPSDIVGGIDFGYTNPFAFLWGFQDGDGCLWICGEHYKTGLLVREHAQIIKGISGERRFKILVADSEDAESRAQLAKEGLPTIGTDKKALSVFDGIMKVKEWLKIRPNGKPRLKVHKSCVNLLREMQSLKWKEGKDSPEDGNDHAIDALRYLVQYLSRPQYSGGGGVSKR